MINYDYDSFSHCHLTDIFFRFSGGSKRVKDANIVKSNRIALYSYCLLKTCVIE